MKHVKLYEEYGLVNKIKRKLFPEEINDVIDEIENDPKISKLIYGPTKEDKYGISEVCIGYKIGNDKAITLSGFSSNCHIKLWKLPIGSDGKILGIYYIDEDTNRRIGNSLRELVRKFKSGTRYQN